MSKLDYDNTYKSNSDKVNKAYAVKVGLQEGSLALSENTRDLLLTLAEKDPKAVKEIMQLMSAGAPLLKQAPVQAMRPTHGRSVQSDPYEFTH